MKTCTFFRGNRYVSYVWFENGSGHRLAGNPGPLTDWNLPGAFASGVDAALAGEGVWGGKVFFFKGPNFVEFDRSSRTCVAPRPLSGPPWNAPKELASGVRAALNGRGKFSGRTYLFSDREYFTFAWSGPTFLRRAPLNEWKLPVEFVREARNGRLRGAINGDGDFKKKAYFFVGSLYVVFDWETETCTQRAVSSHTFFPETSGLPDARRQCAPFYQAGIDATIEGSLTPTVVRSVPTAEKRGESGTTVNTVPTRKQVLYIWLDHRPAYSEGHHASNVDGLKEAARQWSEANSDRSALEVNIRHIADIDEASLRTPDVFALFLAGSHAEWWGVVTESDNGTPWQERLDAYGRVLEQTRVPTIAICGSHQFIATRRPSGTSAEWSAVQHMLTYGDREDRSVATEHKERRERIPSPRIGEVGVFPIALMESDDILKGLNNPAYFIEWHHDEVVSSNIGDRFVQILTSSEAHAVLQDLNLPGEGEQPHLPVIDIHTRPPTYNGGRCRVQGLRTRDSSKVLYSFQFHPEHLRATIEREAKLNTSPRNPTRTPEQLALLDRAVADGQRLLSNFFDLARRYWERGGTP